jgi:hypothetical protein
MIRTITFRKSSLRNPVSSVHRLNSSNGGDGGDKKESDSASPTGNYECACIYTCV